MCTEKISNRGGAKQRILLHNGYYYISFFFKIIRRQKKLYTIKQEDELSLNFFFSLFCTSYFVETREVVSGSKLTAQKSEKLADFEPISDQFWLSFGVFLLCFLKCVFCHCFGVEFSRCRKDFVIFSNAF